MSLQYDLTKACTQDLQNNTTLKVMRTACRRFSKWCKENGITKMRSIEKSGAVEVIQKYTDYLVDRGLSPATVHTYIAPICKSFRVPMDQIEKPKRTADTITRSRDVQRNTQGRKELVQPRFLRIVEFQKAVGIRRAELKHMTGADLTTDETGHMCVIVSRGKGGKTQLQRILPENEEVVKKTFVGVAACDRLFSDIELRNKIDFHSMRAENARNAYKYYAGFDSGQKVQLLYELEKRWLRFHPNYGRQSREFQHWRSQIFKGYGLYRLRGDNLDRAISEGRPIVYDRLALMATSVFHLSHWRLDVTVKNYLL